MIYLCVVLTWMSQKVIWIMNKYAQLLLQNKKQIVMKYERFLDLDIHNSRAYSKKFIDANDLGSCSVHCMSVLFIIKIKATFFSMRTNCFVS
jgi:hypothetical protein